MTVTVIEGDAREQLSRLDEASVHCCVTSPPYWGLRDYGVDGQLGLEATPAEYVGRLVEIFREVRRVLRDDGTLWLNLGDSYATGTTAPREPTSTSGDHVPASWSSRCDRTRIGTPSGLKTKDLCGIPWRVAFALQQPYEVVAIAQRADRAWLAAMIDGEGCITTTVAKPTTGVNESYAVVVQIRMSDRECLDRAIKVTGMGKVQDEALPPSMVGTGQRPVYCWRIAGEKAATVLAEVYPYLCIKRAQAVAAWNLQRLKDGVTTKRGVPIPKPNMEKRRALHRVIRSLNQRQPTTMPSWCAEPSFTVDPGWYLRSDVIWAKPNPMPESVTDRPTKAHEYLFLLSKSGDALLWRHRDSREWVSTEPLPDYVWRHKKTREEVRDPRPGKEWTRINLWRGFDYYFDQDAVREDAITGDARRPYAPGQVDARGDGHARGGGEQKGTDATSRNIRSVWNIATQPFPGAHFAVFPPKLIEPCVKAGCPEGGTVLDPFGGAGTTGLVADRLGRDAILIELNSKYAAMSRERISGDCPLFADVT